MPAIQPALMYLRRFRALLAGDPGRIARWTTEFDFRWAAACLGAFTAGCAVYGAAFGLWRGELQAFYVAVKFPLVVILTCAGNALLNGLLALALGAGLSFRQSGLAILMSFTITGLILAAFAPLVLFILWNTPSIDGADSATGGRIMLLTHVGLIAFAGFVGNHRLWRLLRHLTNSAAKANAVLCAWLAGNLLLGSQISWILRPWIGRVNSPLRFLSEDPMWGNFFHSLWRVAHNLFTQ